MTRAVVRSIGVAVMTVAVMGAADYLHFVAHCEKHLAWMRVQANPAAVVRDDGFGVARRGDIIYTCATVHCFGPIACHEDLGCYCAPDTLGPTAVGQLVGGACTVDKAQPLLSDAFGACRYARCDEHIDH
jgi:hypothetical protein